MPNNIYDNLSDDELKASYWYVTHRILLRKIGLGTLMVVSVGLLIFGIVSLINFYSEGQRNIDLISSEVGENRLNADLLAEVNKPKDLTFSETQVIRGKDGAVNFVTEVFNPNVQWTVQVLSYYYMIGEDQTEIQTDFVLPGQQKYLLQFNYPSNTTALNAKIVVDDIKWQKIADYELLAERMLDFEFENAKVLPAGSSGLSDETNISVVNFDVLNKTSYSYWEPRFVVLLTRGEQIVAVTDVYLDGLATGEVKSESINLFQNLPSSVSLRILPDINILDPDVFMGFSNGSGELK